MLLGIPLAYKKYIGIHAFHIALQFTFFFFFFVSCTILIQFTFWSVSDVGTFIKIFSFFFFYSPEIELVLCKIPMEVSGKHGLHTVIRIIDSQDSSYDICNVYNIGSESFRKFIFRYT